MIGWILGIRGLLKRIPWQAWAAMACIAAVLFYGNHREDQGYAKAEAYWKAKAEALEDARQAALDSEQAALRQLAKETDNAVYKKSEANRDRTERFIASGGVRGQACPVDHQAAVRGTGDGAALHQAPIVDGAEQLPQTVTVLPDDVRTCTENTILSEEWRKLLLDLEAR